MLHSTRGIVFHSLKYSETSVIVKIYTELFGIQSYLVKGVRNQRSKIRPGLFQSVALLDLVVYHKAKQSLQAIKEVRLAHPYRSIPFDIRKSSVALFINELAYKTIREEEPNPALFGFLWETCMALDNTGESVSCYPVRFTVQMMHYLGIHPRNNHSPEAAVFNLREGLFQAAVPDHQHYLDAGNSHMFSGLLRACEETGERNGETANCEAITNTRKNTSDVSKWRDSEIFMDPGSRNRMLETLLLYYQLHLPGFKGVQSHHILHEVLA